MSFVRRHALLYDRPTKELPESLQRACLTAWQPLAESILPVHAALWGSTGTRVVKDRGQGFLGYTVANNTDRSVPTAQTVECITMESLMSRHGIDSIDILKMDIEGSELDRAQKTGEKVTAYRHQDETTPRS